jgi:shikimate kinase
LRTPNPREILTNLMAIRDPLYREIANVIIQTDERPPRMVVAEILGQLASLTARETSSQSALS